MMKKICFLICLFWFCLPLLADNTDYILQRADRIVIYPQKMAFRDGETLMDVLRLYPEILVGGYDNLLQNYQLRMDNVKMNGDIRFLLTQISAREVKSIQIVDNPGVAKGTTGMGGVIDIVMMKAEVGAHGVANVQAETCGNVGSMLNLRLGSKSTELWASASYKYDRMISPDKHSQYLDLHTTTTFGEKDRLLTYFKQDFSTATGSSTQNCRQNYLARARYFHTFNKWGTELLTLLSYQYSDTPQSEGRRHVCSNVQTPMYLLELNTPLFVKQLTLMFGIEGDFSIYKYGIEDSSGFGEHSRYNVFNQDIYAQLTYEFSKVKFTVGDRVMIYHYGMKGYSDDWKQNTLRNMIQGSVIYTPNSHHRLQLGYFRKFINPSYLKVFPEAWPSAEGNSWVVGSPENKETMVDQLKLSYGCTIKKVAFSIVNNYYRVGNVDMGNMDASFYYRINDLCITTGANVHLERNNTYWHLRLEPSFSLPGMSRLVAEFAYTSDNSPHKTITDTNFYSSLSFVKQFHRPWQLSIQWHDMFSNRHSALMASVSYRY